MLLHSVDPIKQPTAWRVGEPRIAGEEIAKQLDFGPGLPNAEGCSSSRPDFDAAGIHLPISTKTCSFPAAPDSSSSNDDVQYTAASTKPTRRRRATLDSDGDDQQADTEHSLPFPSLALQTQAGTAYDFLIASSSQSGDSDNAEAQDITFSGYAAQPLQLTGTGGWRRSGNVIVLVNSDDDSDSGVFCGGTDVM